MLSVGLLAVHLKDNQWLLIVGWLSIEQVNLLNGENVPVSVIVYLNHYILRKGLEYGYQFGNGHLYFFTVTLVTGIFLTRA